MLLEFARILRPLHALGEYERILNVKAEATDSTLGLRMTEQYLDGAQIVRLLAEDGYLGAGRLWLAALKPTANPVSCLEQRRNHPHDRTATTAARCLHAPGQYPYRVVALPRRIP